MARSRNIKPGFFTNDVLGELPPLARLLFAGLWTHCDRDGRCEDRPRKIKAALLPYDDCDTDKLLEALSAAGFIARYEAQGINVIQVVTWNKHQNPHVKEAPSTLPARCEHGASTVQEPDSAQPEPERAGLIPSSLIPDSLSLDSSKEKPRGKRASPSGDEASANESKGRKRPKTSMPADFGVSDGVIAWASRCGFDRLDEHMAAFRIKVEANGYTYVNWDAAFKNAVCDDWAKLRQQPRGGAPMQSSQSMTVAHNPQVEETTRRLRAERERDRTLQVDPECIAAAKEVAQAARLRRLGAATGSAPIASLLPNLSEAA